MERGTVIDVLQPPSTLSEEDGSEGLTWERILVDQIQSDGGALKEEVLVAGGGNPRSRRRERKKRLVEHEKRRSTKFTGRLSRISSRGRQAWERLATRASLCRNQKKAGTTKGKKSHAGKKETPGSEKEGREKGVVLYRQPEGRGERKTRRNVREEGVREKGGKRAAFIKKRSSKKTIGRGKRDT